MATLLKSTWLRYLTTVVGVIEMVLFSGVIYGWANMVLILKAEDYFADLCAAPSNATTSQQGTAKSKDDAELDKVCSKQDDRLTLIFTIAVTAFNLGGFLGGVLFDHFGTRKTRLSACFIYFLVGVFSFFLDKDNANLMFPVIICLAFGGMFCAITLFQLAELHPNHRLAVSSSLSGALDSSSVVFLIFKVCHDAGISFRWIILTYTIIAIVFILVNTFLLMPTMSLALDRENEIIELELGAANPGLSVSVDNLKTTEVQNGGTTSKENEEGPKETIPKQVDGTDDDPYASGWRYIRTSKYLWLFYYLGLLQLRLWFFVGSLNTFLEYRTDNNKDQIDKYSATFGLTQFFGFVFAPFTGIIMDISPKRINNPYFGCIITFLIANFLCITLGVLVLIPSLELLYVSFVVQVAMRAFLYASLISFILKAFPVVHYGKLYGVCTIGAAVFSLLQYPAFIILDGPFDGNPFWVNFGFLAISISGLSLPLYLILNKQEQDEGEVTTTF